MNKYSVSAITKCENNPMRKHKYDFLLAESAKHLSLLSEEYSGRKDMFDIQIYRFSYMQFFFWDCSSGVTNELLGDDDARREKGLLTSVDDPNFDSALAA